MAFGESLLEIDPVTGIAVGIGAIVMWPLVSRVGRPIAKEAVKVGLRLYRAGEGVATGVKEIVAEVGAEARLGTAAEDIPRKRT
ncbi:MAG: DUF5132 domain-containing protein [Alphaproteobacteria bacterium]|nr:DUF5132 domain-containing protein [Alphaproteobacteria bacterium]